MRRNLGPARRSFALIASIFAILLVFTDGYAQHTYYISKSSGSDSNTSTAAQSKSTPWAHLPGMISCTANCASYTPVAGDSFILKGGDTWVASDLGVNWSYWTGSSTGCALPYGSGATSTCIYIGVDQTWFTGSSWARPIFTCGGTNCASGSNTMYTHFWLYDVSYVVVDNIEMTGFYDSTGSGGYVSVNGTDTEIRNCYFHGWSHASGVGNNTYVYTVGTNNGYTGAGTLFDTNVIDGSDTTQDMMNGVYSGADTVFNNYFRYTVAAMLGVFNVASGNTVEYPVLSFAGDHANGIFNFAPLTGSTILMYDNVIRHTSNCPGCVNVWFDGNGSANSSTVGYGFNNVEYDVNPSNILDIGNHPAGNYGTFYIFNNTIECGNDSSNGACSGTPPSGPYANLYYYYNHLIGDSADFQCFPSGGTCSHNTDLVESLSTANSNGYNDTSETYAFSPASASSPTVSAGGNEMSLCSAIAAVNPSAGSSCQNDTVYGVGYNTANHTVIVPDRQTVGRPASPSNWNIGAYQLAGNTTIQPPTNVQATGH